MLKNQFTQVVLVICALFANPLLAQTDNRSYVQSSNELDQVAYQLKEFGKSKTLDSLRAAISMLKSQPKLDRKRQAKEWLEVLSIIGRNSDPSFNETNAAFSRNLIPPRDGKVQFPSGVDPSTITNPTVRAEYEAALKANRDKAERYRFQLQLHRLETQTTQDAVNYLKSSFGSSETDQKELGQMLDESGLPTSKKAELLKELKGK